MHCNGCGRPSNVQTGAARARRASGTECENGVYYLSVCVNRGVDAALGIHTSSASNRVRANACTPGTLVPRTTRIHAINVRTRHYARRRTRTGRCGRECQASVRRPALNRSLRSRGARGASVARVPQARRRRAGHPGGRPHAAQQREGVGAARHGERTRHVPAARRAYIRAGRLYTHGQLCRSAARTRLAEFYWLPGAGGPWSFCEGATTAPASGGAQPKCCRHSGHGVPSAAAAPGASSTCQKLNRKAQKTCVEMGTMSCEPCIGGRWCPQRRCHICVRGRVFSATAGLLVYRTVISRSSMPRAAVSVFFVATMAVITTSQPVSQSILHHINVVAISDVSQGRGRAACSPFATDSVTGATVYNASALAPACLGLVARQAVPVD